MPAQVLALVGPTASGKSRLALDIATDRGDVEIVAVDAFTIYRGMDIGTAKPTPTERAAVPHHGIDVLDPWEEVSVASFQGLARSAIADVTGRGRTPLLVGGSGLYFRAVVDDLEFPPTDPSVRAGIEARFAGAPEAAHAALDAIDADAAARIDPGNLRRSVRALEVIELTGRSFSSYATAWEQYRSIYPGLEVAYVEPASTVLRERIEARAQAMVAGGLLHEVAALAALERPLSRTARQAIGYQEALAVLAGTMPESALADAIADRTWRYARRQRSWFRRDPRCVPVDGRQVRERWRDPRC